MQGFQPFFWSLFSGQIFLLGFLKDNRNFPNGYVLMRKSHLCTIYSHKMLWEKVVAFCKFFWVCLLALGLLHIRSISKNYHYSASIGFLIKVSIVKENKVNIISAGLKSMVAIFKLGFKINLQRLKLRGKMADGPKFYISQS